MNVRKARESGLLLKASIAIGCENWLSRTEWGYGRVAGFSVGWSGTLSSFRVVDQRIGVGIRCVP